jgi:drug/metabolite transporter (DMT)-like permease
MTALPDKMQIYRAVFWVGVLAALWGVIERLGMSIADTYYFPQIVSMRYAVHLVVLFVVCRSLGVRFSVKSRQPIKHIALGSCMLVMPLSFMFGVSGQPGANLWSAFWFMPVLVLVLASTLLGEQNKRGIWAAVLVAHVGALLVLGPDPSRLAPASMIPIIGGLAFAGYVVLLRQLREETAATNLFYSGLVPFVGMAPLTIGVWQPIQTEDVWRIVAIGVVGLVSLYSLDRAMHIVPASFAAPLLYGAVVSELLIELLRSGVLPDATQIFGCMILLAVGLAVVFNRTVTEIRHG